MDEQSLIRQLLDTFVGELDEHVGSMNRDLLALEKSQHDEQRKDLIQSLFRTAHSLKGASRAVNIPQVEQAFHRIEEVLSAVRDGSGQLRAGSLELLFSVVDALQDAGERLRRKQELAGGPLAALLPRLEEEARQARTNPGKGPAAENPPAEPPPAIAQDPAEEYRSTRVPVEKLDRLLSRNDEVLLAGRLLSSRVRELLELHEFVERWQRNWRGLQPYLDRLRDPRRPAPGQTARKGMALPPRMAKALYRAEENLRHLERQLDQLGTGLTTDAHTLAQAAGSMSDDIGGLCMMPFGEACAGLDRIVRDVAKAEGKAVSLTVEGEGVELDRAIIQKLKSPLIQLVRNAVAHGIEPPARRQALGKSPVGKVTVAAALRGTHVEVTVADDGCGLSVDAIRAKAAAKNLPVPVEQADLINLVFHPGFSTASIVTEFSGRGVGLDVVKTELESLHGTVGLSFQEGGGSRFTLSLPLTLTTTRGLAVSAAGRVFAFVGTNVKQLLRVKAEHFRFIEGRESLIVDKCPIPVASLAGTLGIPEEERIRKGDTVPVVVVAAGDRQMAFVVDQMLAERELTIRGLGRRLKRVRNIAGAVQLETGEVGLILNASELVRSASGQTGGRRLAAMLNETDQAKPKTRLIVADDSITTRTLERTILESAGYDVAVAKDGQEAWDLLQLRGADLIVSDIEMPGLSGFELTERVRGSKRFASLPLILVTSRASDEDKARGAQVGASAYLVKSSFDQKTLLETIARLI